MPGQPSPSAFYDLAALFDLRQTLSELEKKAEPTARLLQSTESAQRARRLGVLSGSFNPLTRAHLALAEAARRQLSLEAVLFAVSRVTVDKETVRVAALEDRLLLLSLYARGRAGYAVAVVNRGLYADQAEAVRRALPAVEELTFLIGSDKALQIFDPRYYRDREEALRRLFGLAGLVVAPRGKEGERELEELLGRPENEPYQGGVRTLRLPPRYQPLASSQVREEARLGHPLRGRLPREAAAFIVATGAYKRPERLASGEEIDRYGLRLALLDALYQAQAPVDFRRLLRLAGGDSPRGRALRRFLEQPAHADAGARLQSFGVEAGELWAMRGPRPLSP